MRSRRTGSSDVTNVLNTGDGSFTIFDVQALFTRFTAGPVQNNPALFNVDEQEPPAVTVFDVRALFAGSST